MREVPPPELQFFVYHLYYEPSLPRLVLILFSGVDTYNQYLFHCVSFEMYYYYLRRGGGVLRAQY